MNISNKDLSKAKDGLREIDSIIFDLDGTFWDPTEMSIAAWQNTAREMKGVIREITREEIQSTFGVQHNLIAKKLFPDCTDDVVEKFILRCFQEEVKIVKESGAELYDDIEAVINTLSKKYALFIVSNCQAGYIEAFLEYYRYGRYFSDFECSGNTMLSKAENIRSVIERNGLKSPIYVGDTMGDFESARENNIPFIHAAYGFGCVEEADYRIDRITGLLNLVE
jgi:phosphoglycolate phosphatase